MERGSNWDENPVGPPSAFPHLSHVDWVYPKLVDSHNSKAPSLRCGGTADDRPAVRALGQRAWSVGYGKGKGGPQAGRPARLAGWDTPSWATSLDLSVIFPPC